LMLALVGAGHVSAALDAGRVHASMVREQLESDPDPAVSALIARLRSGSVSTSVGHDRAQVSSAIATQIATPPGEMFGGRRRAWSTPAGGRIAVRAALVLGIAVVVALGISTRISLWRPTPHHAVSFRDRVQLTATGQASLPTISRDGKTLAFATRTCAASGCRFGVDVQDVREGTSNPILQGASRIYQVQASPDGRYLLVGGEQQRRVWNISSVCQRRAAALRH
jgi:hypothetical protein